MDRLLAIAQGNPGALVVLSQLVKNHPEKLDNLISKLESRNIRGSQLYVIWKEQCECNLEQLIEYIQNLSSSNLNS